MDQKLIDKYNPDKFRELSKEDIEAMRSFTLNDVADLAKAYPNKPSGRAYLVLFNTDPAQGVKQLYPLSTWQNLLALWKQQLTKYVAWNFAALHNNRTIQGVTKTGPVQDLTEAEVTRAIKGQPGKTPVTVPVGQKQTPQPVKKQTPIAKDESDGDLESPGEFTEEEFDEMAVEAQRKTQPATKRTAAEAQVKKVTPVDKKVPVSEKKQTPPVEKKTPLTSSQRKRQASEKK